MSIEGRRKFRRIGTDEPRDLEPAEVRPRGERWFELVLGTDKSQRVRRGAVSLVVAVAFLATVIPLALWVGYHLTHVVSRNAIVKGYITNVGSQLSGVVTSVEVDPGQHVTAGQVLARFEDHQLQAGVLRAQSQLAEATAKAAAARAQVEAAHSQADEAVVRYEQHRRLAKVGAIPQDELRSSETRRRTAQALARNAHADLNAAEAEVAASRAELSLAEADLKAACIRAPTDGWVVRRIAEAGASVVVGQPIAALWIGKEVWVEAWIDENDLGKVAAGNPVRVTVKPFPNRVFTGVVETVGISTDYELPDTAVPQPRNARMRAAPVICVRVKLNRSDGLFPGLSAVVGIRKRAPA